MHLNSIQSNHDSVRVFWKNPLEKESEIIIDDKFKCFDMAQLGQVNFELHALPSLTRNMFDFAHGGALTTYIDISTTCALYAFDQKQRTHVSANMSIDFLSPGRTTSED